MANKDLRSLKFGGDIYRVPKPVAKTSAMTQQVGVDSDGKLWTAPSSSGGSGGTTDHSALSNRDATGQHPISAITNLQSTLDGKLAVSQGTSKSGQFLVVGSDGKITTMTLQTWQGGSY